MKANNSILLPPPSLTSFNHNLLTLLIIFLVAFLSLS